MSFFFFNGMYQLPPLIDIYQIDQLHLCLGSCEGNLSKPWTEDERWLVVCMIRDMGLFVCSAPCTLKVTCLRSLCLKYLFCKMRTGASLWEGTGQEGLSRKNHEEYSRSCRTMFPKWSAVQAAKRGFSPLHGGCAETYHGVTHWL